MFGVYSYFFHSGFSSDFCDFVTCHETMYFEFVSYLKLFVNLRTEMTWGTGTGDKELIWALQVELVAEFALLEVSLYHMRIS